MSAKKIPVCIPPAEKFWRRVKCAF